MKPVIIIAIAFVLLIPLTVFAQTSEKSIAYSVSNATGVLFVVSIILVLPILIISSIVLKKKGKLTGSLFKKILAIFGLFLLAFLIAGMISINFISDEEKAERAEEREEREHLEKLKIEQELEKQNALKAEDGDLDAKKEYDKLAEKYFEPTEESVENFVLNYKGQDNSGPTLMRTVEVLFNVSYSNENIFDNPSTTVYYLALEDWEKDLSGRYWTVDLEIETYRETVSWVWMVDTDTDPYTIYPGNQGAKGILDILDAFDK